MTARYLNGSPCAVVNADGLLSTLAQMAEESAERLTEAAEIMIELARCPGEEVEARLVKRLHQIEPDAEFGSAAWFAGVPEVEF